MNISHLQGAQSFSVSSSQGRLNAEQLKALEHNGKADIVIYDKQADQTHVLSGEKIDINEYHQRMGKASPTYQDGPYFNADLRPLQQMDADKDGFLTEAEAQYSLKESLSEGLDVAGDTVTGMAQIGGMYGMAYGSKLPLMPGVGMTAGTVVGSVLGTIGGVVAAPFRGAATAFSLHKTPESPQRWNLTDSLQDIR